jgi:hypothetical protein
MTTATRNIILAALDGDKSVTATARTDALNILDGNSADGEADRVMDRAEVARVLNCCLKSVSRYAQRGVIRAVRLGTKGRRASCGYSARSVYAALAEATGGAQ